MDLLPEISADLKGRLAFKCVHERDALPPVDAELDQLYRRARWVRKNNILKKDPAEYPGMERLLRIAAAGGHVKANIELRDMLTRGWATSADPPHEVIDLVQDLMKRGVPSSYYDMGWYLERGYGVQQDEVLSLKYYQKSADLGSPEGQYWVGYKLADVPKNGSKVALIGMSFIRCAADQGYAEAALNMAMDLQLNARNGRPGASFSESLKYYQIAVREGKDTLIPSDAFSAKGNSDPLSRLDQQPDPERQARYEKISDFLSRYSYLHPTVPDIDEIVPLPPAKLPPWDGKFKWIKEHEANVPPPLPSEERIAELARTKGLDPKTGRAVGSK